MPSSEEKDSRGTSVIFSLHIPTNRILIDLIDLNEPGIVSINILAPRSNESQITILGQSAIRIDLRCTNLSHLKLSQMFHDYVQLSEKLRPAAINFKAVNSIHTLWQTVRGLRTVFLIVQQCCQADKFNANAKCSCNFK